MNWSEFIPGLRAPPLVASCYSVQALRGFCSGLLIICVTVCLWHSNTQQSLQAAYSVHLESLFCWKSLNWYWTCSLVNLYSMRCIQHVHYWSIPVLFLQVFWSSVFSSCSQNKRPDRWWRDVDLAAQSQILAESTVHTSHLLKDEHIVDKWSSWTPKEEEQVTERLTVSSCHQQQQQSYRKHSFCWSCRDESFWSSLTSCPSEAFITVRKEDHWVCIESWEVEVMWRTTNMSVRWNQLFCACDKLFFCYSETIF